MDYNNCFGLDWFGYTENKVNNLTLMKYIYGLNKSGLSLIKYLSMTSKSFIAWDDNEKKRQKISLTFKDIVIRFWIITIVLALIGLATLKIR